MPGGLLNSPSLPPSLSPSVSHSLERKQTGQGQWEDLTWQRPGSRPRSKMTGPWQSSSAFHWSQHLGLFKRAASSWVRPGLEARTDLQVLDSQTDRDFWSVAISLIGMVSSAARPRGCSRGTTLEVLPVVWEGVVLWGPVGVGVPVVCFWGAWGLGECSGRVPQAGLRETDWVWVILEQYVTEPGWKLYFVKEMFRPK